MHSNSQQEDEIYIVLQQVVTQQAKILREQFSQEFLERLEEHRGEEQVRMNIEEGEQLLFKGYPSGSILRQLSKVICCWSRVGSFPVAFCSVYGFDTERTCKAIEDLAPLSNLIAEFVLNLHSQEAYTLGESVLTGLGPRGILLCLGFRKTQGSIDTFLPPERSRLEKAFDEMNTKEETKGTTLTVGARALTKHAHRSSDGFWGKATGSERNKNILASQVLQRLLDLCVWINVHCLPNEVPVLEIRVAEGYGARWMLGKDYVFRGFVEPMMEDGHGRGWRH